MKLRRIVGVGMLGALAVGLLGGCEVRKQFSGQCQTSPPVPHHNYGVVDVDIEVPHEVTPGSTFVLRIDNMVGYPALGYPGSYPMGQISISGPVTPSGTFTVGKDLFYGAPYPNHLELTVTGQPGESIRFGAVSGSSILGQLPDQAYRISCSVGDAEIVTIPIVEPPA